MDFVIKRAREKDVKAMGELHAKAWHDAYTGIVPESFLKGITAEKRAAYYEKAVHNEDFQCYVCQQGEAVIGIIEMGLARHEQENRRQGEIGGFYFSKDWWGSGYAGLSMEFALNKMVEWHYNNVMLWVLENNLRARRFYEKFGFQHSGITQSINLGIMLSEICYQKQL